MPRGCWPRPRRCGWTARAAPASTGPWSARPGPARSSGPGHPGASAQRPAAGASPSAAGAARGARGALCARPGTRSNSGSVTCSPAQSAHLARSSPPALPRAHTSAHTCCPVPCACRCPARAAVAVLEGSCCTMAPVCPPRPAPAPSALCPGASP